MTENHIRDIRKSRGISQKALADRLGITQQAVGKWETGKSSPEYGMLTKIAEFFGTTVDCIMKGADDTVKEPAKAITNIVNDIVENTQIPIIGTVRAGYGLDAVEEDCGFEYANVRNPQDYFFLIVNGDSMEPRIKNGDLALVHKQSTLEDGDLGVIVYGDNEGTLKRFVKRGNMIILQPFNPSYEAKVITGEDLNNVYIAGKVVETRTPW